MSQKEISEFTKLKNRVVCLESTFVYRGDQLFDLKSKHRDLGQQNEELKTRIRVLEKELSAVKEALSLHEAGTSTLGLMGEA